MSQENFENDKPAFSSPKLEAFIKPKRQSSTAAVVSANGINDEKQVSVFDSQFDSYISKLSSLTNLKFRPCSFFSIRGVKCGSHLVLLCHDDRYFYLTHEAQKPFLEQNHCVSFRELFDADNRLDYRVKTLHSYYTLPAFFTERDHAEHITKAIYCSDGDKGIAKKYARLFNMSNMTPSLALKLVEVGIYTPEDLRSVGSAQALRLIAPLFSGRKFISKVVMQRLEGAILNRFFCEVNVRARLRELSALTEENSLLFK